MFKSLLLTTLLLFSKDQTPPAYGWGAVKDITNFRVETGPFFSSGSGPTRSFTYEAIIKSWAHSCSTNNVHDQFEQSWAAEGANWRWHYHHDDGAGTDRLRREIPTTLAKEHVIHVCNQDANEISVEVHMPDDTSREFFIRRGRMLVVRVKATAKVEARTTYSVKRQVFNRSKLHVGRYTPAG